jgi:hypothetical protein
VPHLLPVQSLADACCIRLSLQRSHGPVQVAALAAAKQEAHAVVTDEATIGLQQQQQQKQGRSRGQHSRGCELCYASLCLDIMLLI